MYPDPNFFDPLGADAPKPPNKTLSGTATGRVRPSVWQLLATDPSRSVMGLKLTPVEEEIVRNVLVPMLSVPEAFKTGIERPMGVPKGPDVSGEPLQLDVEGPKRLHPIGYTAPAPSKMAYEVTCSCGRQYVIWRTTGPATSFGP